MVRSRSLHVRSWCSSCSRMIARLGASMRCAPVLALAVIASVLAGNSAWAASLTLDSGRGAGQVAVIAGKDGRQQFIATFVDDAGLSRDVTREAKYEASPAGIVSVDASGLAIPQSEGVATITAVGPDGVKAQAEVRVEHFEVDLPINFPNEIVPIFTKNGCNGGGCHGKASGQNGFKLSLLGFEPREDFEFLTKEARGRRLFPAAPERSLLLAKGTAQVPHGGGARLEADSPAYRMVHRWIAQGMPYGSDADPVATRIEVFPRDRVMTKEASQQLVVIAHYTDGSTRDVTRMTTLTSNDAEMAEVSPAGLVKTHGQTGTVAVMCIFQGHVDVFRATLPLGVEVTNLPEPANFVDELVFNQLKRLGLPPSAVCDDATFLRRVTIALAGRVPTLAEAQAFNADQDSNKRAAAIARLVDSTDYADNFATKWSAILRNKRSKDEDKRATFAFHSWIRDSLYENKPYDQFVRDIVTATGEVSVFPPVAWYRELREPSAMVEDTAQLFLGMRIQCARCHHHPFEKWSQRDYHSFSAFYSRLGRKPTQFAGQDQIFHQQGQPTAQNPKTGEQLVPAGLDAQPPAISPLDDPRDALVDWMTQKDNPFFAKALVNRYWKHFFGRGLVDPEDDMRVTNPASNPELLDALAQDFVDHQFDLKYLVSLICNSKTYQLSAEPNEYNQNDKQNYARFYPRRLDAETMLDAIDQVTGVPTAFAGMPAGVRAGQLPDNGFQNYFLTVFGRPEASSACECERSTDASLAQSLHLLNSQDILGKVAFDQGRAAKMAGEERPFEQRIRELYLLAFSREPDAEEMEIARKYVESKKSSREAFEDVVWALVNTKEFLFNH